MKKLLLFVLTLFTVVTLTACSDVCIGTECIEKEVEVDCSLDPDHEDCQQEEECEENTGTTLDNVVFYDHINGHGEVNADHEAFILFEEEMQGYVKYQVSYLSCTCRPSDVNYWQVMYIEINKYSNDVKLISFMYDDENSVHPYTPGLWGDSSPTPGGKTLEDFTTEFIPWLVGKSSEDLDGISVFTNDPYFHIENTTSIDDAGTLIDDYAGSSVSTNNMIRIVKTMLEYHIENYDN